MDSISNDGCRSPIVAEENSPPVWSRPFNEAVTSVMVAVSWPPLRDTLSDGSLLQVTANSPSSSIKPATLNPVSTPNHVTHSGQGSAKRGGGSSGAPSSSNGAASKPDPAGTDSIPTESPRTDSYRRGNGGPYSRAQGNQHRNFNSNMQSQRGGYRRGGYVRHPAHNSTPFMHPPMRPFVNNVMYPDAAPGMVYYQGLVPPMVPGPLFFPFPDPLHGTIVKQIEYYFSNENLVKDTFLRQNMDEQGWVSANLIAGFRKVSCLTDIAQLILDVMRQSTLMVVQGEKMRRRNDWTRWLMPPAVEDSLASRFQSVGLGGRSASGGGERAAVA
ncbi:la-related protein 1C-like [Bidens hawaiensis]|uniref:la-related protein 1C-like n=1 Tax=Bidens hawaiensis TaxID=980011 RepID=UPI00404A8188